MSDSQQTTANNQHAPAGDQHDAHDDNQHQCRVCRESSGKLMRPCRCSGSIAFVHEACLLRWVSTKQELKCELCSTPFHVTKLYSKDAHNHTTTESSSASNNVTNYQVAMYFIEITFSWMCTVLRWTFVAVVWVVLVPFIIRCIARTCLRYPNEIPGFSVAMFTRDTWLQWLVDLGEGWLILLSEAAVVLSVCAWRDWCNASIEDFPALSTAIAIRDDVMLWYHRGGFPEEGAEGGDSNDHVDAAADGDAAARDNQVVRPAPGDRPARPRGPRGAHGNDEDNNGEGDDDEWVDASDDDDDHGDGDGDDNGSDWTDSGEVVDESSLSRILGLLRTENGEDGMDDEEAIPTFAIFLGFHRTWEHLPSTVLMIMIASTVLTVSTLLIPFRCMSAVVVGVNRAHSLDLAVATQYPATLLERIELALVGDLIGFISVFPIHALLSAAVARTYRGLVARRATPGTAWWSLLFASVAEAHVWSTFVWGYLKVVANCILDFVIGPLTYGMILVVVLHSYFGAAPKDQGMTNVHASQWLELHARNITDVKTAPGVGTTTFVHGLALVETVVRHALKPTMSLPYLHDDLAATWTMVWSDVVPNVAFHFSDAALWFLGFALVHVTIVIVAGMRVVLRDDVFFYPHIPDHESIVGFLLRASFTGRAKQVVRKLIVVAVIVLLVLRPAFRLAAYIQPNMFPLGVELTDALRLISDGLLVNSTVLIVDHTVRLTTIFRFVFNVAATVLGVKPYVLAPQAPDVGGLFEEERVGRHFGTDGRPQLPTTASALWLLNLRLWGVALFFFGTLVVTLSMLLVVPRELGIRLYRFTVISTYEDTMQQTVRERRLQVYLIGIWSTVVGTVILCVLAPHAVEQLRRSVRGLANGIGELKIYIQTALGGLWHWCRNVLRLAKVKTTSERSHSQQDASAMSTASTGDAPTTEEGEGSVGFRTIPGDDGVVDDDLLEDGEGDSGPRTATPANDRVPETPHEMRRPEDEGEDVDGHIDSIDRMIRALPARPPPNVVPRTPLPAVNPFAAANNRNAAEARAAVEAATNALRELMELYPEAAAVLQQNPLFQGIVEPLPPPTFWGRHRRNVLRVLRRAYAAFAFAVVLPLLCGVCMELTFVIPSTVRGNQCTLVNVANGWLVVLLYSQVLYRAALRYDTMFRAHTGGVFSAFVAQMSDDARLVTRLLVDVVLSCAWYVVFPSFVHHAVLPHFMSTSEVALVIFHNRLCHPIYLGVRVAQYLVLATKRLGPYARDYVQRQLKEGSSLRGLRLHEFVSHHHLRHHAGGGSLSSFSGDARRGADHRFAVHE
eukprot:PhM_4_TR13898/c0_g1_i1/m.5447